MKRFVYKLFIVLFPVIVLLIGGELYMRNRSNAWSYKMSWMDKNASDVEVLVMGGSKTFDGIVPSEIKSKAFNFARDNGLPEYDLFLLKKYLPKMKKLHTVIMQLDEGGIIQNDYEYGGDSYHTTYYKVWMGYNKYPWYSKYNFFLYNPMIYFRTIRKDIVNFLSNSSVSHKIGCDSLGWGGMERTVSGKPVNWKDLDNDIRAIRLRPSEWRCCDNNILYYHQIAALCKLNNIRLILVSAPSYPTIMKLVPKIALEMRDNLVKELIENYGAEYGDYTSNSDFNDDDFFDPVHLSDIGDIKLTKLLINDFSI